MGLIRVLHCIHSLSGGGAERQLKSLVGISHQTGMEAAILCVEDKGNDIEDPKVKIFRSSCNKKYNFPLLGDIYRTVCHFKPDIVHAWLPPAVTIPAMLAAFATNTPCVFSYRNAMKFHRLLTLPEYFVALGGVKRIVSNNPISQSSLAYRKLFSWKQGVEIRNAVNVDRRFRKTNWAARPGRPKEILFVGRLTRQKNLKCLLDSLPLLQSRQTWRLTICGEGEDRTLVESLINKYNLADKVSVAGYQSDIYAKMSHSDFMVLPSLYEGMPNVLLEALAIGLPCIVSALGIHKEITNDGQCALLFDPHSPKELAATIDYALSESEILAALASIGFEVAERSTPLKMAEEYRCLYQSILGANSKTA